MPKKQSESGIQITAGHLMSALVMSEKKEGEVRVLSLGLIFSKPDYKEKSTDEGEVTTPDSPK